VKNKFIFDVDGTLTPSRQQIDNNFREFMIEFAEHNDVYLVTGSDYGKTVEQVGIELVMTAKRVYNCSGNDVWENGNNIYTSDWKLPEREESYLQTELELGAFPLRTGLHFEHRPGTCNFSMVGRNATLGERKLYVEWDTKYDERECIARSFNKLFPESQATVGGETGIDIHKKGNDKSQILRDFSDDDMIFFFGDRTEPGGNDYPLAQAITVGMSYQVNGWEDTWSKLNAYLANGS